jgi:putative DNA primase/helicase
MLLRWLISAVAAAFEPDGVAAGGILVLQGAQYLGKTKWFKSLVPQHLGLTQDGMMLRPDDRDSVKQSCSFWLVELGELDATFRKSDIAALKAFITRKQDVMRRAYARKESHYARRTVFFASVNQQEFLADPTGNRRYWTISCEAIDHTHDIDMQQVWAEVYDLYKEGVSWYLEADEVAHLNSHNEQFSAIDPVEQRIQEGLDWNEKETLWRWTTVTRLLIEVGVERPTHADTSRAGTALSKKGVKRRILSGTAQICVPSTLTPHRPT